MPEDQRPVRWPSPSLAVLLVAALCAWAFACAAQFRGVISDVVQDFLSAKAIRAGVSVYTPIKTDRVVPGTNAVFVNDHPPTHIVALSPLGLLPYQAAFLALAGAGIGAVVFGCAVVAAELKWSVRTTTLVTVGMLLHPGTSMCLAIGNIYLLLFLLLALGWRADRGDRPGAAGVWLGVLAAVKLYPGLLVLGLSRRGAACMSGIAAGCWAATAALLGPGDIIEYAVGRAPVNVATYAGHGFNLSVVGVAYRAFGEPSAFSPWLDRVAVEPGLATALAWAGRLAVIGVVAVGLLRARHRGDRDRAFAVLIPGMLLLSPLTWLPAVPMMLIPVGVLARVETGPRLAALVACALAMCLDDRWLAVQWLAATNRGVPWQLNLVLLAPTWGMVGTLLLASFPRHFPEVSKPER